MKPEISEEIISGWRREFEDSEYVIKWRYLLTKNQSGEYDQGDTFRLWSGFKMGKTSSHERVLELEKELNDSINFHCPHFLTNDSGTVSCHSDFVNKLTKRDELLREAEWIIINADHGDYPEKWIKSYEQLEQEK